MPTTILSVDDLSVDDIENITARARQLAGGSPIQPRVFSLGLMFLTSSFRTRVGFSEAAIRLGGTPIYVSELRFDQSMSGAESFEDALRTLSGMVDAVVVRAPFKLDRETLGSSCVSPLINGGDAADHPSQALIDLLAIEAEKGPIEDLHVCLCGDLTMRGARSLLGLFNRRTPARLTLVSPTSRSDVSANVGPVLEARIDRSDVMDLSGADVVHMIGLPPRAGDDFLDDHERQPFFLTPDRLDTAANDCVVLSPLPVIDEVDADVRSDPRLRMFEQSDRSIFTRMALLEHVMGWDR